MKRNRRKEKKRKSGGGGGQPGEPGSGGTRASSPGVVSAGGGGPPGSDGEDVARKPETPVPDAGTTGDDFIAAGGAESSNAHANAGNTSSNSTAGLDPWADFNRPDNKFYSSSDSGSDTDSEKGSSRERSRRIKVEIKPVDASGTGPTSASVDELRTAVGVLELAPPPPVVRRDPTTFTRAVYGTTIGL